MGDYYQLLGLPKNASETEIRTAFRKLAKRYHPDINKSPDAHSRFIMLTTAYETLIDLDKRQRYNLRFHNGTGSQSSNLDSYSDWLKAQRAKAEYEAKLRYYEFLQNREKFRQSKYYKLAILITHVARIVCFLFAAAIIAVCLFLIVDLHFMLFFCLLPFMCGAVFLIKWTNQWYQETRRYF
jgi:curved DNA-binding protein CbpA